MAKKILIIEDDKNLQPMYIDKFSQVGFEVFSCPEAKEGFELAKKIKPDLVLLDILLPKEDGIYFLKTLREDEDTSQIPVVVFSNLDNPYIREKAMKLGISDYLIKTDFTPKEIVDKINRYLKNRKSKKV